MERAAAVELAADLLDDGGDTLGLCLACGAVKEGVEPDAEGYECEECGAHRVMGLEQVVLTGGREDG